MTTRNTVYAEYYNKLNSIDERLANQGQYMTKEEKARYITKRDMIREFLTDLANMESID